MKFFSRESPGQTSTPDTQEGVDEPLEGDRGIPSVNRARSVQSRVSSVLAFTLMSALGLGLLTWYYARTLSRPREVQHAAQLAAKNRAQGEMALPSLGRIDPPVVRAAAASDPPPAATGPSTLETLLGPAPALPSASPAALAPMAAPGGLDPNRPEVARRARVRAAARGSRLRACIEGRERTASRGLGLPGDRSDGG